jgi:aldehyde:ferredoxin oxidoreductase
MGSKRLKAIAVRGVRPTRWHSASGLHQRARQLSEKSFGPATAKYRHLGTAANLLLFNRLHALPTRNFQAASLEGVERISAESLSQARQHTRASCAACTIGCEHIYSLTQDDTEGVRLEYESLFALGPLCGITDPDAVLTAAQTCDLLGMDTISTGGTIAFAMECAERGLVDAPWLRFGRPEGMLRAVREIGTRQGLGDRLAEGSRRLAEMLGGDAPTFAPHVKGLEIPGYEPRTLQTMALGFAVGTRGADHNRSGAYEVDFSPEVDRRQASVHAVPLAVETEDRAALLDSMILCKFLRGVFHDLWQESAEILQLVTGWDVTGQELRTTARRIINIKKAFNIRAGWTPAEDTLPPRFLQQRLADDPAQLDGGTLSQQIRTYNQLRGWTDEGYIPAAELEQLT